MKFVSQFCCEKQVAREIVRCIMPRNQQVSQYFCFMNCQRTKQFDVH